MTNSLVYHKLRILYWFVIIFLVSIFFEQSDSFFFSSSRGRIQGPSFLRRTQFHSKNIGPILDHHRSLARYHHVVETLPVRTPIQKTKPKFPNRKRSLTLPYNITTVETSQKQTTIKEASCIVSTAFVKKLEKLMSTRKTGEKLHKLWKHWKNKSKHCKPQGRSSRAMETSKEPETGYYHDKNLKSIVTLTGLGSLLTTGALLWLSLAEKSKKLKKGPKTKSKKRLTQHLHLHPILGALTKETEKEAESKEEKSEESGKKRAAVKIGLATEILAINAESIHLTAHIIEFLFIMTKLARALATAGMPAPAPFEGNKLLTPAQAQELIQMIEKESSTSSNSIFGGIDGGELKNPLHVIGKNITASAIFQGALKNPTALGIQNLFSAIKGTGKIV